MDKTVTIRCLNTGSTYTVPAGSTLEEIFNQIKPDMPYGCICAKVNNKVEGLHYTVFRNKDVEFLDLRNPSGMRTYTRSLFFVLCKAVGELYPAVSVRIETSVSNGYYCRLEGLDSVSAETVDAIRRRMEDLVAANLPYHRITCPTEEAVSLFRERGMEDKASLLEGLGSLYTHYYTLGDTPDYYYGALLIRTGQLGVFGVEPYFDGLLLRVPDPANPAQLLPVTSQPKMFGVFQEQHRWQRILGVSTIGELNRANDLGQSTGLINVSEALQEKTIARLADRIAANPQLRVILIAGPSSSGKTTFAKRLSVQLFASGKKPVAISLDDYFVNRNDTPRDANGELDFESLYALNIPLFNANVNALLKGEEVSLPRFNFQTGLSEASGRTLRLEPDNLIILEGIHALNPLLTQDIPAHTKFRIYASALTSILLDAHNYVPTTDNRLLRRIVRDHKYRGYSALDTIRRWPSVRAGEQKWIFPYQEEADEMVNTALLFEVAALREEALPLLEQVPESVPEYAEAHRLKKFLGYLKPISTKALPPTSLLREFLGGSTFKY